MSEDHAKGTVTIILNNGDFSDMVGRALQSIVNQPYRHHLVVLAVGQNAEDNPEEGWFINYRIEED